MLVKGKRKQYYNHISTTEVFDCIGPKIWNSYFKFCVDRNPYDKTMSLYYIRGGKEKFGSVQKFIENGSLNEMISYDLCSLNRLVGVVNVVYKYKELDKALEGISEHLKLDKRLTLKKFKAKSNTRKDKRHYSEVLSSNELDLKSHVFQREIFLNKY